MFNTTKNKEFLWKFMYENQLFKNIDNVFIENIQIIFEKKVEKIDMKKKSNTDTLTSLNKQIINEMVQDIKSKSFMQMPLPMHTQLPLSNIEKNKKIITAQEILQSKQNIFDEKLKSMKDDFDTLINAPKPTIIDFTDKINNVNLEIEEIIPDENLDIERLLAETIAKRENMLITVNENEKNTAANWVNNNRELPKQPREQQTKTLKIGKAIEKVKKNVSFNDDNLSKFIPIDEIIIDDIGAFVIADAETNIVDTRAVDTRAVDTYAVDTHAVDTHAVDTSDAETYAVDLTITKQIKEINIKIDRVLEMLSTITTIKNPITEITLE